MNKPITLASFVAVLILAAIILTNYISVIVVATGKILFGVLFGAIVYLIVRASMPLLRMAYRAWSDYVGSVANKLDKIFDSFVDDGF